SRHRSSRRRLWGQTFGRGEAPVSARTTASPAHRTDDELLRFHHQEEHETAEDEPAPDPERDGRGLEQRLKRRGVREETLQDHNRPNADAEILVAEMGLKRQG